jgi:hypothetical protein
MRALMQKRPYPVHSWRELLGAPPAATHLLQLYDDPAFLGNAVAHFAAEGLALGEAVLLTGTPAHLAGIQAALGGLGVDRGAAERQGRLELRDVQAAVPAVCTAGRLDRERFVARTREALEPLRSRGTAVRWWGEMSNTLHAGGDAEGALDSEALANGVARDYGATIFCSFECDRFDAGGYAAMERMCRVHSHVIPADDYARLRLAVNRAVADVVGELRGSLLQSLSSWKGMACELPSSQALLFWLREALPESFDAVLARARFYHGQQDAAQAA